MLRSHPKVQCQVLPLLDVAVSVASLVIAFGIRRENDAEDTT